MSRGNNVMRLEHQKLVDTCAISVIIIIIIIMVLYCKINAK